MPGYKPFKMKGFSGFGEGTSPMKGYKSDAQRRAVHASKADGGKGNPNKMHGKYETPMKAAKPDYIDLDGDGNKTESMKKAAADKKAAPTKMYGKKSPNKQVRKGAVKKGRSQTPGPVVADTRVTYKKAGTSSSIGPQESPKAIAAKEKKALEEAKGPSGTSFDASAADRKKDMQERKDYSKARSFVKMKHGGKSPNKNYKKGYYGA